MTSGRCWLFGGSLFFICAMGSDPASPPPWGTCEGERRWVKVAGGQRQVGEARLAIASGRAGFGNMSARRKRLRQQEPLHAQSPRPVWGTCFASPLQSCMTPGHPGPPSLLLPPLLWQSCSIRSDSFPHPGPSLGSHIHRQLACS